MAPLDTILYQSAIGVLSVTLFCTIFDEIFDVEVCRNLEIYRLGLTQTANVCTVCITSRQKFRLKKLDSLCYRTVNGAYLYTTLFHHKYGVVVEKQAINKTKNTLIYNTLTTHQCQTIDRVRLRS